MEFKLQLRTVVAYMLVASLWIWASDRILDALIRNVDLLSELQTLKGWAFVVATGLMLYVLIGRDMAKLEAANRRLAEGHEQAIRAMTTAMDVRHRETGDHTARVTRMTQEFARLANVPESQIAGIRLGALLHDMGKLAVPDQILLKPGPLDPAEMAEVRQHPTTAMEMMSQIDFLRDAIDIPYAHHEHWDGSGYPRGLAGKDIPFAARLFSVVDIWDALLFPRIYKDAWAERDVLDYLRRAAGTELDPDLVKLFLLHYPLLRAVGLQARPSRASAGERSHGKGADGIPGHLTAGLVTEVGDRLEKR
jgi:putative nucleotidyltransferase with HDIG domain